MLPESRNIFVPGAQPNNSPPSSKANTDVRIPVDETSSAASEVPASHSDNSANAAKTLANAADLAQAKIESLKKWTVSTYKTTRHSINEQLGKATRTVDADLDQRIDALRELHCRYQSLLKLATAYTGYFSLANNTQRDLAEAFYQLSHKEDALKNELCVHSESLRGVCQNGDILFRALSYFTSAMQTLSDKTIQDTLLTVDRHDQARLEYDVYRCELENLRSQPNPMASLDEAEQKAAEAKSKYDQLKEDVRIKLTLLEENRGKVMRRQIALVQKAFSSYFEGNTDTLKKTLEQLGDGAQLTPIEDDDPMSNHVKHPPSFLENNM